MKIYLSKAKNKTTGDVVLKKGQVINRGAIAGPCNICGRTATG